MNNVEDIYPLTPLQEGILFHTLYNPGSQVYVSQLSCRFEGDLDIAHLRQAWQGVIDAYPVLRTAFLWDGLEQPYQVVRQQVDLPWTYLDWQGVPALDQQQRLDEFLAQERIRGFDLTQAPLLRLAVIQLGPQSVQFAWTHHHLLLDGWSMALVLKAVFTAYQALVEGQAAQQPEQSRPYRDYIAWLQEQDKDAAESFWRQYLQGFTEPNRLQMERLTPSAELQDEQGHVCMEALALSAEATTALEAVARRHQLTVNTVVQGAWAILVSRYSGNEDIVFGATLSGRPADLPGVESMVGLFINTLPVRVQVSQDAPLIPWLQALQAQQLQLRQFEFTPLVQVQAWSEVPTGTPLLDSLVAFENYPMDQSVTQHVAGLRVNDIRVAEKTNYPLSLTVRPGVQLQLGALYDGEHVDVASVRRILSHMARLLQAIGENPQQALGRLPMLTDAETAQLAQWCGTTTALPSLSMAQLFAEQVASHPEKVALALGDQQLSFGELDQRSNQLAHALQRLGVGTDTPVGLCLERSLDQVVALLGVLKAGGAYVPFDPAYPAQRLSFMLQDSGVPVLITERRLATALQPQQATHVLYLDEAQTMLAQEPTSPPPCLATVDSLAYIMYTSGSTGQPKGIAIPQRAVVRLVKETDFVDFGSDQVWLQYAPISFDASTLEIWGALLNGATLAICPPGHASLDDLGRTIARHQVTSMWLTAGLFHEMVDGNLEGLLPVRQLLAGGDVLSAPHVERVLTKLPQCRLINGYGPTENTTFTCCHTIKTVVPGRSIPIGKPITNTQVYILDAQQRHVPVGVPGELHAGGDGLARGYWNRPDLTDERFVPNPFGPAGSRLYRTGDLARWLPDGTVEFLGRRDFLVKIRGFRIELGEIESALVQHPQVREAVVVSRESAGTGTLVAYVVPVNDHAAAAGLDPADLREFLRSRLPDYMVPSGFVTLESLPLTPNGKVDRKALPDPHSAPPVAEYVAPATDVEIRLADIWSRVLEIPQVGVHDNFFDLGGHSLLATRSISQIRDAFQIDLTLQALFERPTIAALAPLVDELIMLSILDEMDYAPQG
ncbi:MAG TPA: amino acid adenylation domain-containing protein [Symbiobacteriaceae bacterium]|nr:amino acid adenylation domain-containing protein [Symbiobacteriaceae bacterium]